MSDLEIIRDLYDAMAAGDLARIFEHLHADIVVTQDPALPWADATSATTASPNSAWP
jgi:ketosteroid isomerase-like protein